MNVDAVWSRLDELQSGAGSSFLLYEAAPTGLGGQLSGRIAALLVGIATDRGVIFSTDNDPPYVQSIVSLSVPEAYAKPVLSDRSNSTLPLVKIGEAQDQPVVRMSAYETDLGGREVGLLLAELCSDRLSIPRTSRSELEGAIFRWFKLLPEFEAAVSSFRTKFMLDDGTIGVHVRRGDKRVETPFVPLRVIEEQIAALADQGSYNSVFVATDDESVLSKLKTPKGLALKFDSEEVRYNNANHKMLLSKTSLATQETRTAIVNIHALSACGALIGQDNAHFAIIAGAVIESRVGQGSVTLISGSIAEKHSLLARSSAVLRRELRAMLRSIFPFLTLRYKAQRGKIS